MEGDPRFDASQNLPNVPYHEFARMIGLRGIYVDDPARPQRGAEAGFADHRAAQNAHSISDQGEADHGVGPDDAVAADGAAGADHRPGPDARSAPDLGPGADDSAGLTDDAIDAEIKRFRSYNRARGTLFTDLDAAWEAWCLKAKPAPRAERAEEPKPPD